MTVSGLRINVVLGNRYLSQGCKNVLSTTLARNVETVHIIYLAEKIRIRSLHTREITISHRSCTVTTFSPAFK